MTTPTPTPAPRLQLRWEKAPESPDMPWLCHYELVLPLKETDIRGEQEGTDEVLTELVIPIKEPTMRGGGGTPCEGNNEPDDAPFRDGVHAMWDAKHLGDLPIYVIAPNGTATLRVRP